MVCGKVTFWGTLTNRSAETRPPPFPRPHLVGIRTGSHLSMYVLEAASLELS